VNFKPGLYIVSTPIGNLSDITLRALEVLKNSDIIFCEDTRVSNKLLAKHQIKASLKLYNDNSDSLVRNHIKKLIEEGKIVSLISDAGTPLISDPGYKLVRDLKLDNLYVDVIPGSCAAIAALTLSGLPTDKFYFAGFLPKTKEGKLKIFKSLSSLKATLIFYETAPRLLQTLETALEALGDRQANVARELTKLYQESNTAPLSELIEHYTLAPPKGEIVLSIHGLGSEGLSIEDLREDILQLLEQGLSAKSVSDTIFTNNNEHFSRKDIYRVTNEIKAGIKPI
jgi:16S rRNA (cytidine1402-2'-O)-methyltransferase